MIDFKKKTVLMSVFLSRYNCLSVTIACGITIIVKYLPKGVFNVNFSLVNKEQFCNFQMIVFTGNV